MTETITLDKIEQNLALFRKMYDAVRTVDPLRKQVLEYKSCEFGETGETCHDYWQNQKICDNCISMRAYLHDKNYVKLEQHPDRIMLVTAIPLENVSPPVILELLKNATDSMLIGNGRYSEGHPMHDIVPMLNDAVVRDALTGLYNRRYIDERLPADVVRATLEEAPLSMLFMDIDNLKSINDTYGHPAGDAALKQVAKALCKSIRVKDDWAARYGGDEFLVCLPQADSGIARDIAERIRRNIGEAFVPFKDSSIPITVSQGIYTLQGEMLTAEELVALADRKMYEAKQAGRNRIHNL